MRELLIVPIVTAAPLATFQGLQMVTGDPLATIVLGLILFITFAAWFSRPAGEGRQVRSPRFG